MFIEVGVLCRVSYSIVIYMYAFGITWLGKRMLILCYRLLVIMWFLFEKNSSWCLVCAAFLIVALPGPSMQFFQFDAFERQSDFSFKTVDMVSVWRGFRFLRMRYFIL